MRLFHGFFHGRAFARLSCRLPAAGWRGHSCAVSYIAAIPRPRTIAQADLILETRRRVAGLAQDAQPASAELLQPFSRR